MSCSSCSSDAACPVRRGLAACASRALPTLRPTPPELLPENVKARWPRANQSHSGGGRQRESRSACPSPASCRHSTAAVPLRYHPAARKSANGETDPLPVRQENQRKLQAFGGVQRHQRDLGAFVIGIGIAHQRRVIEKLVQSFAAVTRIHGGIHQFAQVLDPRESLGRVFFFELLDVASAVDKEFQKLGGIGAAPGVRKARLLRCVRPPRPRLATIFGRTSDCRHLRSRNRSSDCSGSKSVSSALRRFVRQLRSQPASRPRAVFFQLLHIVPASIARPSSIRSLKALQRRQRPLRQKLALDRFPIAPHNETPVSSATRSRVSMVVLPIPRTGVLITRSSEIESSRIVDDLQIRNHVLDFGALVERKAAHHVILQLIAPHGLFKQPRLRIGAIKHRGARSSRPRSTASRRYFAI